MSFTFCQIGRARLYHGDCAEVLGAIKRPSDHALVTDPPYGIGIGSSPRLSTSRGFDDEDWDHEPINTDWLRTLISSTPGYSIIWGGNYYTLPPTRAWIIWDKQNDGRDFADAEMAWTNLNQVTRLHRQRPMNMDGGKEHPTQKPVALMKFCLSFLPGPSGPGGVDGAGTGAILDPYMGSGSTGVAAVQQGRDFIGIERSARHFDTACRRLTEAQRQLDLFLAPSSLAGTDLPDLPETPPLL